jgi:ubiquinone/menaquinone biosynthesis C-methylase UbiE
MTIPCQKDAWNKLYDSKGRQWKGVTSTRTQFPFGKGDRVLDIGCGNGKTSSALMEMGCEVIGIDISEAAVEACRAYHGKRMKVECASADSIPLGDGSVDGVAMVHVLEHLTSEELETAVKETQRVLKKNGKIFVCVFHKDDMRSEKGERIDDRTVIRGNGIRYHYFDEGELKHLFSEFREISAERVNEATKFGTIRSRMEAIYQK